MMKEILKSWNSLLEQKKKQDSKQVVKAIIVNSQNKVLFLRRSDYVEKFAGEWDLPGGHTHVGEGLIVGLRREVREETALSLGLPIKVVEIENIIFYTSRYIDGDIILSDEHTEYLFRDVESVKNPNKFEKVALEVVKNDEF
jgi:8-oxo-dGTP pyrophosphatase MutT (NUDIX family)